MTLSSNLRKILFYGTDDFSTPILSSLHSAGHSLHAVTISHKRPTKVAQYCSHHDIPCETFNKDVPPFQDHADFRQNIHQHIGVVASFGRLIPRKVISNVNYFLNVHPSMIPKYRGAAPIQHALLNGDTSTGITILEVLPRRFDVGRIFYQEKFELPRHLRGLEIRSMLAERSGEVLLECLNNLENIIPWEQSGLSSKAPSLRGVYLKELSYVDPREMSSERLYNISRVVTTGLWVEWNKRRLKLKEVIALDEEVIALDDEDNALSPGEFLYDCEMNMLVVRCRKGCLGVKSVILPDSGTSSDMMLADRFYMGHCKDRERVLRGWDRENSEALVVRER